MNTMSKTRALARIAVASAAVLAVGIAANSGQAEAEVKIKDCTGYTINWSIPAAGYYTQYISAENLPGIDMVGRGDTYNGQAACVPHNGWTAEEMSIAYYASGGGWVGCPGAYGYQSSNSGAAWSQIGCDGAQYYLLATSHRVWFSGSPADLGWKTIEASW